MRKTASFPIVFLLLLSFGRPGRLQAPSLRHERTSVEALLVRYLCGWENEYGPAALSEWSKVADDFFGVFLLAVILRSAWRLIGLAGANWRRQL